MAFVHRQLGLLEASSLVEIVRFSLRARTSLKLIVQEAIEFSDLVMSFRPDIVHAHYGTMTSFFCAMTTNKPLVITFRGSDLNPAPGDSTLRNRTGHMLSQLSALRADSIICVSQQLKDRLWWRKDRTSVIPMGVNLALFRPMPQREVRGALGWDSHEKIVLFNAGADPIGKRLDLTEGAVRIAVALIPDTRLVTLRGDVPPDKMPLYYNAADCLLMTSDHEGSPNVVKEAIACGLPVVSVEVGDVRDRLEGVFPSMIIPRDISLLGGAVCQVLESGLRSNGHQRIQELAEERIAELVLRVYESVLR